MLQEQKTEIFNFIKKRSNKTRRRKLTRTLKRNK